MWRATRNRLSNLAFLGASPAMAVQYTYVMKGLTKTFPGASKPVLNNIHLQFLPDAKIAIIGPNGSGKSTLMKIMGGIDPEFVGEAWAAEEMQKMQTSLPLPPGFKLPF
jgi:ATPase subunit of ABC transporter with duplicated ATPase domains